jgi:hypothetical protein
MSKKNKGGRPKKENVAIPYPFPITASGEQLEKYKEALLSDLKIDPYSARNEIMMTVEVKFPNKPELPAHTHNVYQKKLKAHTRVITGAASEEERQQAAKEYLENLEKMTPEKMRDFFNLILTYKAQFANLRSRVFHAIKAAYDYESMTGRQPSKPKLKAFILANRDKYTDAPSAEDGKGWTDLWKNSGLASLANR